MCSCPGSTFLEKDGTFTNAERRINRVRKVMSAEERLADWEVTSSCAGHGVRLALQPSLANHG
jgi:predicted molibdopterin-dependent oxidoreductase YjgC